VYNPRSPAAPITARGERTFRMKSSFSTLGRQAWIYDRGDLKIGVKN